VGRSQGDSAADWATLLLGKPGVDARRAIRVRTLECLESHATFELLHADMAAGVIRASLVPQARGDSLNLRTRVPSTHMAGIFLHLHDLLV